MLYFATLFKRNHAGDKVALPILGMLSDDYWCNLLWHTTNSESYFISSGMDEFICGWNKVHFLLTSYYKRVRHQKRGWPFTYFTIDNSQIHRFRKRQLFMQKYFVFVYLTFMSLIVLYFLHSSSVLSFYTDVVLTLSTTIFVKIWNLYYVPNLN